MRLLEYDDDGKLSLTEFFDYIPRYAVLSHTWGPEEVTFRDLMEGNGTSKAGYEKIRFCGEQAGRDGLQYFWVDTCCIDKSSSAELQEAINSMFGWYRDATRCYVFLSDVPQVTEESGNRFHQFPWEAAIRASRWFTRGWTLQELIAPASVEFFSRFQERLGDKISLGRLICEITRIPSKALRGGPLSEYSVIERMSWAETRQTSREEDIAYSLLGIFDAYMPLIYGEGRSNALKRLQEAIDRKERGIKRENFSIPFSLSAVSDIQRFVARDNELGDIYNALSGDGSRRAVVLHGLGGIGKTQLAVAYAKRHKDYYSAIFWLNIKDENSVKQSFFNVARQILREHPSFGQLCSVDLQRNLDEVVDGVKAWLSMPRNTRWLVVYDNYDNPKVPGTGDPTSVDIQKFLPESYQGSIIITTRSSQVTIGHQLRVRKLENENDSLDILLANSRREDSVNDPDATKLAQKLDGLPLALATAGAYLNQVAISFSDYLRLYEASWLELQKTSPILMSYEDRMLYSTWQLSLDHIKERNKLSVKLLQLWAYFDNRDVWFELLRHGDSEDPEWICELTKDEISFTNAIRVLCDYDLVERDVSSQELVESKGYSMHSCIHSWTIHALNQEWDHELAKLAFKFIGFHVAGMETDRWWLTQRRLLQHAARCLSFIPNDRILENGLERAFQRLCLLYADQGKRDEAERMYMRALQEYEEMLGPKHELTLSTVHNLGMIYWEQGRLDEAENLSTRALHGRDLVLGPQHPSTLDTIHHLARLRADQNKLDEAEELYIQALEGREVALGPNHTSTLFTVNNLGNLYLNKGKLDKAEKMYVRAIQGYEKSLGRKHTTTLLTIGNLGSLYRDQGRLDEAEKMCTRSLCGLDEALGQNHVWTLTTLNNIGNVYKDQGKLDEAEEMYLRVLHGFNEALGPKHISSLSAVYHLTMLYTDQNKLAETEKMYMQALQECEEALGSKHTSTLSIIYFLAELYEGQDKLGDAENMYLQALQGYEEVLGLDHTSTLDTVSNLGRLYRSRCHHTMQQSNSKKLRFNPLLSRCFNPQSYITKLVDLYIRYPTCQRNFLTYLCAMLRWVDEDKLSLRAFSLSASDSLKKYWVVCDGCKGNIGVDADRFACKSCMDIDFCRQCFEKYEMDEPRDLVTTCQDHHFIEYSEARVAAVFGDAGPPPSIEQWLQELKSILRLR